MSRDSLGGGGGGGGGAGYIVSAFRIPSQRPRLSSSWCYEESVEKHTHGRRSPSPASPHPSTAQACGTWQACTTRPRRGQHPLGSPSLPTTLRHLRVSLCGGGQAAHRHEIVNNSTSQAE
ncbi:hypothetical protein E2C01_074092 [Portunus trituberculatus]|uniref:Uncharacterized protein n=1 Tax=Portunus trituberculatus TaxID=210409 RepID=A0A5B7I2H6_PORTR|nr:hypothetical protein [Portunus trituberculatus]